MATGGNVWAGIGLGAAAGAIAAAGSPSIGAEVFGRAIVRGTASGAGNAVGQLGTEGAGEFNAGSFVCSVVGGSVSGGMSMAAARAEISTATGAQILERSLGGIPGGGFSTTSSIVGTILGRGDRDAGGLCRPR